MKLREHLLTEIGYHPSHMEKDDYHQIMSAMEELTDAIRDAHRAVKKYQLDTMIKMLEKQYEQTAKKTVAFSKKYSKKFGGRQITGFRSL